MGNLSKVVQNLPEGYGYVLLAGTGNMVLNMWMAMNVGRARKKFDIKYPAMYHPEPTHVFNCIQRVHQNTCENNATIWFLLLTSGLQYPKAAAIAGGVYLLSRVIYAKGYYSGDPKKRMYGGFGYLAQLFMLGGTVSIALQELNWWPYK